MAVYLICFALSAGLLAWCQHKKPAVYVGVSALALLLPCLLCALRAQTVGTDVMVYVKPLTQAAIQAENLEQYFDTYWFYQWRNVYVQDYELGFSLLVYVSARLSWSLSGVLFAIAAFVTVPIFLALARNGKDQPVWLGMLVFYLLFFNSSLNMMRQWVAMSFLILGLQMLRERKLWLALVLAVVAFFFHATALVALPLYLLLWFFWLVRRTRFVQGAIQVRAATAAGVLLFLLALVALLNLPLLVRLLQAVGLDNYDQYLVGNDFSFSLRSFILRLPLLAVLLLSWKDLCAADGSAPFYLAMVLLDVAISQLGSVNESATRIASYCSMFSILWLPSAYRTWKPGKKRCLLTVLVIGYCLVYWYYTYVYTGRHQTVPYQLAPF